MSFPPYQILALNYLIVVFTVYVLYFSIPQIMTSTRSTKRKIIPILNIMAYYILTPSILLPVIPGNNQTLYLIISELIVIGYFEYSVILHTLLSKQKTTSEQKLTTLSILPVTLIITELLIGNINLIKQAFYVPAVLVTLTVAYILLNNTSDVKWGALKSGESPSRTPGTRM